MNCEIAADCEIYTKKTQSNYCKNFKEKYNGTTKCTLYQIYNAYILH